MPIVRRFLRELRASVESPSRPLTDVSLLEVLGPGARTDAGPYVTEETSVRVIAVYRALALLAGTLGSLSLRAYRGTDSPEAIPAPLLDYPGGRDPLTGIPTPGSMSAMRFWELAYSHLFTWGNAYLTKVPSVVRDDLIVRLEHLQPARVQPKLVKPTVSNPAGKEFAVQDDSGSVMTATPKDVLHVAGFGLHPVQGISPIGAARQALGLALAAEEYGARLFGSGSLMSGILQTDADLTQEQAQSLKDRWTAKLTGLARAHEIAVLDHGAKFQPVSMPPGDTQFIESRKFSVVEIARLYGIPPHLLGDVERSTSWGTGIEQQTLAFIAYTLRPPATRLEQAISNELLPRGQVCRTDFSELLRGDSAARFASYATGITNSILTVNEARKQEGLPAMPGGDRLLMMANLVPFSTKAKPAAPVPPALAAGDTGAGDTTGTPPPPPPPAA